jgi:hypothetical protein
MIMYFKVVSFVRRPGGGRGTRSEQPPRYSTSSTKIFLVMPNAAERPALDQVVVVRQNARV